MRKGAARGQRGRQGVRLRGPSVSRYLRGGLGGLRARVSQVEGAACRRRQRGMHTCMYVGVTVCWGQADSRKSGELKAGRGEEAREK